MSSNREDVQLVLDNRCNVSKTTHALVKVSGNNVNFFEVNADTVGPYTNILNFNSIITPALASTVISRNPRIRYQVTVQVNETAGGAVAFPAANYFPVLPNNSVSNSVVANTVFRAFCLQSITSTLSMTINGATTTLNSRQMLDFIQRRLDKHWIMNQATECPCQPDNLAGLVVDGVPAISTAFGTFTGALNSLQISAAGAITQVNGAALGAGTYLVEPLTATSLPHANQVLSRYENSQGANRGSFKPVSVNPTFVAQPNPQALRTYTFDISEPILLSPFTTYDNETYLANINTMSMVFNLQNVNDMLVSAVFNNAGVINGYNPANLVSLQIENAKLEWEYIQIPQDLVTIPPVVSYPYENLIYFQKSLGTIVFADGIYSSVQSDTLRFSAQPDLIAVYVRQQIANRDASTSARTCLTDTFFGIGNSAVNSLAGVQVNYGVKSGQLAGASSKTLFRMSKRNGWKGSWNDWCNGQAVLLINPTLDLGLDLQAGDVLPMEAAANQNFQIQLTINDQPLQYANVAQAGGYQAELMICPIYKGVINITPNSALYNLGELSHSEVQQALQTQPKDGRMVSDEVVKPTVQGGSLFGTLKSLVGTTANALKSDAGQKALSMISSMAGKGLRR